MTTTGPLPPGDRALGPDLARGVMLLFIALANSHYFLTGTPAMGGFPLDGSRLDAAVTWALATFVDGRAYPLFGLLFGYGVAVIVDRNIDRGARAVRRLLWRRSAVLVAVGVVDGLLFYVGDILAMYGVLLALGALVITWRDRWLLTIAGVLLAVAFLPSGDSMSISTDPPGPEMLPESVGAMVGDRLPAVAVIALLGPLGFAGPFLVGLVLGRRRVLERVADHRRFLAAAAVGGITVAVIGAQPSALVLAGVVVVPGRETLEVWGPLHDATGVLGGFGYAALIVLVADRIARPGAAVTALAATGQRSMTCYLAQSVAWAVLFTPFLLGLAGDLGVAGAAALATLVWAATVLMAEAMRRAGNRGPFETLVRRVTYGGGVGRRVAA
ncbi:MAG: DUF418 domain-containing protein [Thermoleophilia bacterium]